MRWTWQWAPATAEHFGDNPIADWVRVAAVLLAMLVVCATGRVLVESTRRSVTMPWAQVCRFIGLALACVSLAGTEIAVVGSVATPRLVITLLALGFSLYGVWGMRQKQLCDPPVR